MLDLFILQQLNIYDVSDSTDLVEPAYGRQGQSIVIKNFFLIDKSSYMPDESVAEL